nr:MAG TPA: hypothetical protein [Caudoviricetes sp.]
MSLFPILLPTSTTVRPARSRYCFKSAATLERVSLLLSLKPSPPCENYTIRKQTFQALFPTFFRKILLKRLDILKNVGYTDDVPTKHRKQQAKIPGYHRAK